MIVKKIRMTDPTYSRILRTANSSLRSVGLGLCVLYQTATLRVSFVVLIHGSNPSRQSVFRPVETRGPCIVLSS